MTEKLGTKQGILHTDEGKFFAKIVAESIPVKGIWQQGLKLVLPSLINGLDDKVGDKIPEPWQSYTEDLITSLYDALQDKVITEEEEYIVVQKCATIMSAEINIPLIKEEDEVEAFLFLLKFIASQVKIAIKNKTK